MAKAKKQTEIVEKEVKTIVKESVESVTLTLTLEEASTIMAVFGKISGPYDGPRNHTGAVYDALVTAGVSQNINISLSMPWNDVPKGTFIDNIKLSKKE